MDQTCDSGLRLAESIATLSLATDLGTGVPMQRALRACLLAVHLGEALGLGEGELAEVYYLALLRWIGCTTDAHLAAAVFGDEIAAGRWFAGLDWGRPTDILAAIVRHVWASNPPLRRGRRLATTFAGRRKLTGMAAAHCEVAQRLAERLGLGEGIQLALTQVQERWDGRGMPAGIKGAVLAPAIRVVALAHDAETFYRVGGAEAAVAMAQRRAGGAHDPEIVACFCRHAGRLLGHLEAGSAWEAVMDAEPGPRPRLTGAKLDAALNAMADFADLKSPYLVGHSRGVAELAAGGARQCRLPEADVVFVHRAGLLHDLGRVGVSAGVWGKPGPLTDDEWEQVRLHPYGTERVLSRSGGLAPLAVLASLHHERLDGSGYHRGAAAAMQPMAARILAAADVYQALTEPRPHRPAYGADQAADELRREVRAGRLEGEAANAVLAAAGHRVKRRRRDWPAGLSEREIEVLRLVARGLSNRQMAECLSLSESTVHHHIQHIYDKLGVSTRAAATLFAMQHDLLGDALPIEK